MASVIGGEVPLEQSVVSPGLATRLRWHHLALTVGVTLFVALINRFYPLSHPGPLLLVPLAYVSAVAGAAGATVACLPLLFYYAYHVSRPGEAFRYDPDGLRSLVLFAASGVMIALIVGRSGTRRRRAAATVVDRVMSRQRAETGARLAEVEDLNQTVLDSLPAHVAVIDARGQIVATNRAWRQFQEQNGGAAGACGVGSDYLNACRCATGESSDQGRQVAAGIESILRGTSDLFTFEYPCHAPNEQRWFLLSVTPLASHEPGKTGIRGAVLIHLNITDRKLNEETVRQRAAEIARVARDLKRTNEELDQFAYITSHDLRAPLRGIANLSQWIEEDMGDRFTPEAHQQMELLRGRVHRMEAMIDGILEYSRIGRVKVETQQIDVGALLAEVIDMLDPPAGFEIVVEPGMPVVVGHKLRVQQVFMNLLGNAIKHHDKPAGRVVVSCRKLDGFYEFAVADNGPGIAPQYHEKVFVIFQTLQPRDKVEGTGLGLSLVKKIVEAEGGTITLESQPGVGTTFRFTWPRR